MVLVWRRTGRVGGCQIYARVAQLVEHLLAKERVAGSSPVSRLLKKVRNHLISYLFCYFAIIKLLMRFDFLVARIGIKNIGYSLG